MARKRKGSKPRYVRLPDETRDDITSLRSKMQNKGHHTGHHIGVCYRNNLPLDSYGLKPCIGLYLQCADCGYIRWLNHTQRSLHLSPCPGKPDPVDHSIGEIDEAGIPNPGV